MRVLENVVHVRVRLANAEHEPPFRIGEGAVLFAQLPGGGAVLGGLEVVVKRRRREGARYLACIVAAHAVADDEESSSALTLRN